MMFMQQKKTARVTHPSGDELPIRVELFSTERLEQHAISLAKAQKVSRLITGHRLLPRVNENSLVLFEAYTAVAKAVREQRAITPGAEWLLDNFHIIEEQISSIHVDLPERYYRELPKLSEGFLVGYPRVYGIVWALVAHTDSRFTPELLTLFVKTYQQITPLTLGELWAIPITLRVLLVENLRRLAVSIMSSQIGRQLADDFVDQVEQICASTDRPDPPIPAAKLPSDSLCQAYAVQILLRSHDSHPSVVLSLDFLNDWLHDQGLSLEEVVHREHFEQIADNLTFCNIITSMRAISAFDWSQFVENVSHVDACLRGHAGYADMDFLTRDRYRHAIEEISKRSPHSETEIAQLVINKIEHIDAQTDNNERLSEPGYYLIDAGRYAFEIDVGYRPTLKQKLLRICVAHAGLFYISNLVGLTLLLLALPLMASIAFKMNAILVSLLGVFLLFPVSDIAIGFINQLIIAVLPPRHLPRLEFKEGVPKSISTMVVVPTMFFKEAEVLDQVKQMEIRYLSNPDGEVYFALLSDWLDANQETLPNDQRLLQIAVDGVSALNTKYCCDRFFVFHRKRLWNPSEAKWMGWERKRGKLHEFNCLLRGAVDTSFLPINGQPVVAPPGICYVITLDADTKLPMGVVSKLVGVAAHPLNRPVFDSNSQRIVDGYGILQPRVTPTLPLRNEHSMFHRIFAGASGTDAYSSSVSELYQDLFTQGTYSGKGLYHVDSFIAALAGRVPENTQLSHDLFESIYARCALVNDIEFFDEFPSHTEVAASRAHRWVRGDWQLLPWIFGISGRDMSFISRWKMLDNLRRSLSAPATFIVLVLSWAIPESPQALLISMVLISLSMPLIMASCTVFSPSHRDLSLATYLRTVTENVLWALANSLVALTFLVLDAWLMTDAIVSTLVRLLITRRRLLKWVTALQAKSFSDHGLKNLIQPLIRSSIVVFGVTFVVLYFNSAAIINAVPFLLLWLLAPIIARYLSLPPRLDKAEFLQTGDAQKLQLVGRRIWRFFTTFVTAEEHYLPPDNFQEDPLPVIAHRSSPTNFGLYLLSIAAARDFGWIGLLDSIDRTERTLNTLNKLPRLNGHFYNWYDTCNLHILEPGYISTVDSGNLAGHLLTLAETYREILRSPLIFTQSLTGLIDTHSLLSTELAKSSADSWTNTLIFKELEQKAILIGEILQLNPEDPLACSDLWRRLTLCADNLVDLANAFVAERGTPEVSEVLAWSILLSKDIYSHFRDIKHLLPWINYTQQFEAMLQISGSSQFRPWWKEINQNRPLNELAEFYAQTLAAYQTANQQTMSIADIKALVKLRHAGEQASALTKRLEDIVLQLDRLFQEMDFSFLYHAERHLFSIGYRVMEGSLDPSYYDLLASEARLASLIAIAKREAPSEHWFHLGRRVTRAAGGTVLMSWSGSMFEYLMPSLVTFTPRYSLLDQTCRFVIKRQIEYGKQCGIPWGVSESAFNSRDIAMTYQYSAFGVPGLGMKRGLGEERVVAPYATALAAMYLPHAAVLNFDYLQKQGALGRFGFYEALDYTPIRLEEDQRVAIVRCYMAHHQGMSLVAIANTLYDGVVRHRFHNATLVQSADLLLQERVPQGADTSGLPLSQALAEIKETVQQPIRRVPSPMSSTPSIQLLSNGRYAVMITSAGSGYSLWRNLAVTRWREDVTRDSWGSYLYLRDVASFKVWSAGYQPTTVVPDRYEVVFMEDRARITRSDDGILTTLEIVVSPEDDAEIRRLSLTNNSLRPREIEVTSYAEIVLATMSSDIAHPAFSNLFVQTEYQLHTQSLLAHRRKRTTAEPAVWAAHVLTGRQTNYGMQYETDRSRFIGRGQNLQAPIAIMDGRPLSNTVGSVLDPIFSLRTRVRLEVGATEHLTFTTLAADSRQAVADLIDKYNNAAAWERVSALAWTHAQVQLHHLRTKPEEAQLFQYLANRLIYAEPSLRPPSKLMLMNTLNVTGLWRYGISGDRPIILLRVRDSEDHRIITQLLCAYEYWRIKGLSVDLVILNDKEVSYVDDLQMLLDNMVRENQARFTPHKQENQGAIFVLRVDQLSAEERLLLQTAARAVLVSNRGTLAEQLLLRHPRPETAFIHSKNQLPSEVVSPHLLPVPALEFFNGLGGFTADGSEYVIVLDKGQFTPTPWINVIANPEFGFMVSESGSACTWSGNSNENLLTPWSNDPVSDPSGEIFYIRDDETMELWCPTALPIRVDNTSYVIHHGQGYSRFEHASHGIYSELLQFVSPDDPVKISCLTLKNLSGRRRKLSVTAYLEWVLGTSRAVTAPYIVTELDIETGALFAQNPWISEFGTRVAFADLCGQQSSWTGNRTEFIGRNGCLDAPAGLLGFKTLKNRVGAGLDPCAALETVIELAGNAETEIIFLLGQGDNHAHAVELVKRYRLTKPSETFNQVQQSWQSVLGKVQVKTPDQALDLLLNGWLLYQTLSCRMWARAAFYQLGGAFGFRDQLQDSMALAVARPDLTRKHLLLAAERQFVEGDVQHWWHPPTGRGVRTHFSDDRLWLPYAVTHYIKVSGDTAILDSSLAFLEGPELKPEQEDAYFEPNQSIQEATLYEHCVRALDYSLTTGAHGLPLIGSGDWNDGMNRVGREGRGESIWLAWFLIATLDEFAKLAEARGEQQTANRWRDHISKLKIAVEAEGWDGAWYRRAYFDDGTPLGSAINAECRIDSIAQSWAVISGAADSERAQRAMHSVREYLVRLGDDLMLLFTPPFDKTERDPGYIKGYPPGVRENGGQYTHAAIWSVIAFAMLGEGDQAVELLRMLNPIKRTSTRTGLYAYKVEPYVLAADIYSEPPHVRRGGWTWYTGAAGWFYRAGVETILGFQLRADCLVLNPCIPMVWTQYSISYQHKTSRYEIKVENPNGVSRGIVSVELDGVEQVYENKGILLKDDGQLHHLRVTLGTSNQ